MGSIPIGTMSVLCFCFCFLFGLAGELSGYDTARRGHDVVGVEEA